MNGSLLHKVVPFILITRQFTVPQTTELKIKKIILSNEINRLSDKQRNGFYNHYVIYNIKYKYSISAIYFVIKLRNNFNFTIFWKKYY